MIRPFALAGLASAALCFAAPAGAQEQEDSESGASAQVLACEEAARLSIDRDRRITSSIEGAQEPDPIGGGGGGGVVGTTGAFPGELSRFEEDQRRRRLIDDCLARAGLGEEPAPQ